MNIFLLSLLAGAFVTPKWLRLPVALRRPLLMSLSEVTPANCMNSIEAKCAQVLIPSLYLSESYRRTVEEKTDRSTRTSNCEKRFNLIEDLVFLILTTLI